MNLRILSCMTAAAACALVSCYPLPDPAPPQPTAQQAANPPVDEVQRKQTAEQRERVRETAERETGGSGSTAGNTAEESPRQPVSKPPEEAPRRQDYKFATPVPGKEGMVFSPYNNKMIDVRGMPSGTLVHDPTYPASEKKYFRVP